MLERLEQQQVATLHGLPARNRRDASQSCRGAQFYRFNEGRATAMASDSEHDVEETAQPPQKQWTAPPTPIALPARTRNQLNGTAANNNARNRAVLPVVPNWTKRTPAKIQKLNHTADVSLARKSNGLQEVIVVEDEQDERPTHTKLGVKYAAPFSPPKDKNKKKRTADESDPIDTFDDDDDLEIVDGPEPQDYTVPVTSGKSPRRQKRRSTPTRYHPPAGMVKQRIAGYESRDRAKDPPPDHDFSKSAPTANGKKVSVRGRMKGKQQAQRDDAPSKITQFTSLMVGRDANDVSLNSRFGKGMSAAASRDEVEKWRQREKRFGPVVGDSRSVASTSRSGSVSAVKRNPPFEPIPIAAFCLGMQRWCDGAEAGTDADDGAPEVWLVVTAQALEVHRDAECTDRAYTFRKEDILDFETTGVGCAVSGGMKFRLKPQVKEFDSHLFDSEDIGAMGWITLRFAQFAPGTGWTKVEQERVFGFIVRFAEKRPDIISITALDAFVAQACQEAAVAQQARRLQPPRPSSSKKRASNASAGSEDIRRHLQPKGKGKDTDGGKGVAAESFYSSNSASRWSGDAGEAGPSMHLRSRSSSTYRAPDADDSDDPLDTLPGAMPIDRLAALPPVLVKKPPRTREKEKEKENLEEIILVWPRGGPGALNISLGDLRRLEPGEFLNDTLIEFGLKYWLSRLRETNPEIADDVHVFSSFFYKKLNQKIFEDGYQSVRKWTNKVDIFKKKYIIVPINEHIHWYLAIIYQPEYVLRPPPPKTESPRRVSTRIQAKQLEDDEEKDKLAISETPTPTAEIVEVKDDDQEQEQEQWRQPDHVPMDVDGDGDAMSVTGRLAQSSLEDSARPSTDANIDPALLEHEQREEAAVEVDVPFFDDDELDETPLLIGKDKRTGPPTRSRSISLGSGQPPPLESSEPTAAPTPATIGDEDEVVAMDVADSEDAPEFMKMPYIFTFDSLGGRHPQAIKNLQKYLAAEAEDKRKIPRDQTTVPDGKKATVPTQPNYCDCGLYLLHFAETFVSEPEKYTRAILTPPKKQRDDKNKLWQNHELAHKRETLENVITGLSKDWKEKKKAEEEEEARLKALRDQDKAKEESDDEIVCEPIVVPPKKPTIKAGQRGARK